MDIAAEVIIDDGRKIEELQSRVKELEAIIAKNEGRELDELVDLRHRIQDAQRILGIAVRRESGTFETRYYYDEIGRALKILEGE